MPNSLTANVEAHEGGHVLSANLAVEDKLVHFEQNVFLDDLKRSLPASTIL